MLKFISTVFVSIIWLCSFSHQSGLLSDDGKLIYVYKQYSDSVCYTNVYKNKSLLYGNNISYTECSFDGDLMDLKKDIFELIKSGIPDFESRLETNKVVLYLVLLPNNQGDILDLYMGWNSCNKNVFMENEILTISDAIQNVKLKMQHIGIKEKLYCHPLTISFD